MFLRPYHFSGDTLRQSLQERKDFPQSTYRIRVTDAMDNILVIIMVEGVKFLTAHTLCFWRPFFALLRQ